MAALSLFRVAGAASILLALLNSPLLVAQSDGAEEALPVLTLSDAVSAAQSQNNQVLISALEILKSAELIEETKTSRYPKLSLYANGGLLVTPLSFTIPAGALGNYPGTGPIPGKSASITTSRTLNGLVYGSVSQPLTQLFKINLAVKGALVGLQLSKEAERQQRIQTVNQVKTAYYALVQTQSRLESAAANLRYLLQLAAEIEKNVAEQTALKADSLSVNARISEQRYQQLTLRDSRDTQRETLNRLMGRDLSATFLVEIQPAPQNDELDLARARKTAIEQRPETRQAHLQLEKAGLDVRRQRAQYIPDISLQFNYFSAPNINFLPRNAAAASVLLQWEPFDWGRKRHQLNQLEVSSQQATVSERDARQQILIDVGASLRKLREARAFLATQAAVTQAEEEKLRVLLNKYKQKAALLSDVLQEQSSLAQANSAQAQALASFWTSKADFERSLGEQ